MSTRKTTPTPAQPSKPSPDNLSPLKAIEPPNTNPNQPTPQGTPPLKELVKQYHSVSLLLQGGGALGAYQAGVYEGLHKQGIKIDCISGISIGALNTAIIAGNRPENRLAALQGFWNTITHRNYTPAGMNVYRQTANELDKLSKIDMVSHFMPWIFENGFLKQQLRVMESTTEAWLTMIEGQRGFFKPRYFVPYDTTPNHLSYYTTDKLRETLERYCDLKLVNDVNRMKVSVSAVNVRNGNFAIFSNENEELHYDHFIASGALPPGFPAVEIDGEYYWDGGLVSNTPLNEILSHEEHLKQLIFQVDLWNAKGTLPENMMEIDERIKDIRYSSRTRMVTDFMAQKLRYTRLIKELLEIIDDDAKIDKVEELCVNKAREMTEVGVKNVIHLIYHKKTYERGYKDYEFSASTMREHWESGLQDIENTFRHPDWFMLPETDDIFVTHDIHQKRKKLAQVSTLLKNLED
ncbi:MAG TPA: phospholipase [Moraxella sp.]|nr:phospholipase [Moraxella sp.]